MRYQKDLQLEEIEYYELLENQFKNDYGLLIAAIKYLTSHKGKTNPLLRVVENVLFLKADLRPRNYDKIKPFIEELLETPTDTIKDFLSTYEPKEEEVMAPSSWEKDLASQKIAQYDKEGNFVRGFKDMIEASKKTGIAHNLIGKSCNNIISKVDGFIFKLEKVRINNIYMLEC